MFLRDTKGQPVGCIAIRTSNLTRATVVSYQLSVLNPKDNFNRSVARQLALGRLVEQPLQVTLDRDPTMHEITSSVMTSISSLNSLPGRARRAAHLWLRNNTK